MLIIYTMLILMIINIVYIEVTPAVWSSIKHQLSKLFMWFVTTT